MIRASADRLDTQGGRGAGRGAGVGAGSAILLAVVVLAGCSQKREEPVAAVAPYGEPIAIAVAPALNFSNAPQVDPLRIGDLMASELSQWGGVNVIGVNRVMAVLSRDGRQSVESPAHALDICRKIGADAILVFSVEEFDPYAPPVVRLSAQLYGPQPRGAGFDPVTTSRQSRPFETSPSMADELRPWSQMQKTWNAGHETIQREVERYGRSRDAERSPMGWRKYLASQELFMRFCCYSAIQELMVREQQRSLEGRVAWKEPAQ